MEILKGKDNKKQKTETIKKKYPPLVNVKKNNLQNIGYDNIEEWIKDDNNVYIGRRNTYVKGTFNSKWGNPFKIAKDQTREQVVENYRNYIKENKELLADISELQNKSLGCWCYPELCHGNVLLDLLKEYQQQQNETKISQEMSE